MPSIKQRLSSNPHLIANIAAGLVGLAVLLEVSHAMGLLETIKLSGEHATEAMLVACFILCFLLREEFSETERSVRQLNHSVQASANVSTFSDRHQFHSHWKYIRDRYPSVALIGSPPASFVETGELEKLQSTGKRCSFYLDINVESQAFARDFLDKASKSSQEAFKLHDLSFPLKGFWVLGLDHAGTGVEAIICYPPLNETSSDGLYLTGPSARSFSASVTPTLSMRNVAGELAGPTRIYSNDQIDMILDKKTVFAQDMLDIDSGRPLRGIEEVCAEMKRCLNMTSQFLDVTHICNEKSIPLLKADHFTDWVEANYAAVERQVKIRRIFIIPRALRNNSDFNAVVASMTSHRIQVLLCDREALEPRFIEDFSLYDDKHLIYISREGGAWMDDDQARARSSDSLERVQHFRNIFNTVKQRSK